MQKQLLLPFISNNSNPLSTNQNIKYHYENAYVLLE